MRLFGVLLLVIAGVFVLTDDIIDFLTSNADLGDLVLLSDLGVGLFASVSSSAAFLTCL